MANDLRLKLTPEQQAILLEIHTSECQKQLATRFVDPDKDQRTIRSTIHLAGGIDMLVYLLQFDSALDEQLEQTKQELLHNAPQDNPSSGF